MKRYKVIEVTEEYAKIEDTLGQKDKWGHFPTSTYHFANACLDFQVGDWVDLVVRLQERPVVQPA